MEITQREFLTMKITPGIPDYSCPSLLRRRGNDRPPHPQVDPLDQEDWANQDVGECGESPGGAGREESVLQRSSQQADAEFLLCP